MDFFRSHEVHQFCRCTHDCSVNFCLREREKETEKSKTHWNSLWPTTKRRKNKVEAYDYMVRCFSFSNSLVLLLLSHLNKLAFAHECEIIRIFVLVVVVRCGFVLFFILRDRCYLVTGCFSMKQFWTKGARERQREREKRQEMLGFESVDRN